MRNSQIPENTTCLQESPDWHAIYDSQAQVERRRAAIPEKLRKIGLAAADRKAQILDLCCGMGFRNLHGVDVVISPSLAADARCSTEDYYLTLRKPLSPTAKT